MKKLIVFLILAMTVSVHAATLKWDASTGAEGYNVYFSNGVDNFNYNAGNVTEVADIDNTLNLNYGQAYVFQVTGYNDAGESGLSNEANYNSPLIYTPPGNIIPIKVNRPSIITIIVE